MEEDGPSDSVNLRLVAAVGVTPEANCVTEAIEQFLVS